MKSLDSVTGRGEASIETEETRRAPSMMDLLEIAKSRPLTEEEYDRATVILEKVKNTVMVEFDATLASLEEILGET